jgi:hypothetical protein
MSNRIMDPHELGVHSVACTPGCCARGIVIEWERPFLLDSIEKVHQANAIRARIGGRLADREAWKLGDHCWYAPEAAS